MMERHEMERLILLDSSGEITEEEARQLQAHMDKHPDARAFRDQQSGLIARAGVVLSQNTPHPSTRVRIRDAAQAQLKHGRRGNLPSLAWRGLAYAAALTILFANWSSLFPDPRAGRILEINGLMAAASDATQNVEPSDPGAEPDLQELGRQLLQMQGLAMEENDYEVFDPAPASSHGGPAPTASQENNTRASLPRKYV
jgi:hypothetical protein